MRRNKNVRLFLKENRILIIFFIMSFIVMQFLPISWSDDEVFVKKAAEKTLLQFLQGSARPFTDGLTYIFARFGWLWRILNPCVLSMLIIAIEKLFPVKLQNEQKIFLIFGVTFSTMCVVDAGFIATTVNYLWPITFAAVSLIPLKNIFSGTKTSIFLKIISVPMLIYATNMQQICVVLFVIFLFTNIYFVFKKQFEPYILLQFLLTLIGALLSYYLNFAGENSRLVRETIRYFPDFGNLSFIQKIELGFSSTFYCLTMNLWWAYLAYLPFAIFLAINILKKKKEIYLKIIALIPPIFTFIMGLLSIKENHVFSLLKAEMESDKFSVVFYLFSILYIAICITTIVSFLILIKEKSHKFYALSAFLLGLGSRMLMGFSPTVWASGYRTFAVMFLSMIFITLFVLVNNKKTIKV